MPKLSIEQVEQPDSTTTRGEPSASEILARQARGLDEYFRRKQELWDTLSPTQQAAEEAAFEQVMRNIDERQRRTRGIVDTAGAA